jgi:RNA polymerase sigma-70 factor (ECF subfamily)
MRVEQGTPRFVAFGEEADGRWHADDRRQMFEQTYRASYPFLVRSCRRWLHGGGDAEAIAQEAFLRAWASQDRFGGARFRAWVFTIARRLCIDACRRSTFVRNGAAALDDSDEQLTAPVDEVVERNAEQQLVFDVLPLVPIGYRRVIALHYLNGWTYQEIAQAEGTTVNAVKARLNRARTSFREAYAKKAPAGRGFVVVRWWHSVRRRLGDCGRELDRVLAPGLHLGWSLDIVVVVASLLAMTSGSMTPTTTSERTAMGAPASPAVMARTAPPTTEVSRSIATSTVGHRAQPAPAEPEAAEPTLVDLPSTLLPGNDDVETMSFRAFTPSPRYESDGRIFATGFVTRCGDACPVLLLSTDRGATWQRLLALGYVGGPIALSPAYPDDGRIFAITFGGTLQVSNDAGTSFVPVPGIASGHSSTGYPVVSPTFEQDGRILVAPGLEYLDDAGAVVARTVPYGLNPRFSPAFGTDRVMFYTSGGRDGELYRGSVKRCVGDACTTTVLAEAGDLPDVAVSRRFPVSNVVLAGGGGGVYYSGDGGRTYGRLAVPLSGRVTGVALDSADRLYVAVRGLATVDGRTVLRGGLAVSSDSGRSWRVIGEGTPLAAGPTVVDVLPDGRLLAGRDRYDGGGLWCSVDEGSSWHSRCPGQPSSH